MPSVPMSELKLNWELISAAEVPPRCFLCQPFDRRVVNLFPEFFVLLPSIYVSIKGFEIIIKMLEGNNWLLVLNTAVN